MKYITRNIVYNGFIIKENNTEYLILDNTFRILEIHKKKETTIKQLKKHIDNELVK